MVKKSKIVKVETPPKPWGEGSRRTFYYQIELENGDKGSIGTKKDTPYDWMAVGEELEYTIDDGNKIKRVDDFKKKAYKKDDPLWIEKQKFKQQQIIAQVAFELASDWVVRNEGTLETILAASKRISFNIIDNATKVHKELTGKEIGISKDSVFNQGDEQVFITSQSCMKRAYELSYEGLIDIKDVKAMAYDFMLHIYSVAKENYNGN